MTRRALPLFAPRKPIRAPHLNRLSTELGRLTGLPTGGDDLFIDNACGRFSLPPTSAVGTFRVRITETTAEYPYEYPYDYPGDPVAVYATSHPYGFSVIRVNNDDEDSGAEFTAYADPGMYGVHWTGRIVRCERRGSQVFVIQGGQEDWHEGFTAEAIDEDAFGDVQLFDDGPVIEATSSTPCPTDTFVGVTFDSERQEFKLDDQRCPPPPDEEEEYGS